MESQWVHKPQLRAAPYLTVGSHHSQYSCSFLVCLVSLSPSLLSKMREKEGVELWTRRRIGRGNHIKMYCVGGKSVLN